MRQFLGRLCPEDLEETLAVSSEVIASIYVFGGELDGEVDCETADLTGGPDLSS